MTETSTTLADPLPLPRAVLTVVLTALSVGLLTSAAEQLRVAKSDAFDSIIALSQARSVSYDANADESRFLVDPQRGPEYQQASLTKSQSLLDLPGTGLFQYDTALATALAAYHANNTDIRFTGYEPTRPPATSRPRCRSTSVPHQVTPTTTSTSTTPHWSR